MPLNVFYNAPSTIIQFNSSTIKQINTMKSPLIPFLALALLYVTATAQNVDYCQFLSLSEDSSSTLYYKKSAIPAFMKEALVSQDWFGEEFKMANPHASFNRTDVVRNPHLPNKRMVFLLRNGGTYVLVYEYGGRASGICCVLANEDTDQLQHCHLPKSVSSFADFVTVMRQKCQSATE